MIIFVINIHEGSGDCNKFHNEELHDAFPQQNIYVCSIKKEETSRKRGTCWEDKNVLKKLASKSERKNKTSNKLGFMKENIPVGLK